MFSPDFIAAATGPVKAFLDSDFCGQLIVLIQIGMSIYSWSVMLRRNLFMKDIQRRSDRFADDFVKASEGPIGLYCDRNYTFTDSPMESVYTKTCDRLIHLIPQNQLKALHLDSSMPLTLSAKRMALVTATASHALEEEINQLNKGMTALSVITSSAPLLGLFGTVWGVMLAFQAMAASGSADIAELAPGISSALLTTVVGLVVAIPSTIAYSVLQSKIDKYTTDLEGFSDELIGKLSLFYQSEKETSAC